jgi:hypothetical protein
MRLNTTLSTLLLVFCWILCSTTAFAQTTWYSQGSVQFDSETNWNTAPDGSGTNMTSTDVTNGVFTNGLNSFVIQTGNDADVNETIDINNLTVETGAEITRSSGNQTIRGNIVQNGTLDFTGGSTTFSGTTSISGTGSVNFSVVTVSAASSLTLGGNDFNVVGTMNVNGTANLTMGSGTLSVNQLIIGAGAGTVSLNSGTITFTGIGNRNFTFNKGTTLPLNNLTVNKTSGNLTFTGTSANTFQINGTFRLTSNTTLNLGTGQVISYNGASATLRYEFDAANRNASVEWPTTNGPSNIILSLSAAGQSVTLPANRAISRDLVMTQGILALGTTTLTILGDLLSSNVSGNATISASSVDFTTNAGVVVFGNGTSAQNNQTITGSVTMSALAMNKDVASGNMLTISGNPTISSGIRVRAGNFRLVGNTSFNINSGGLELVTGATTATPTVQIGDGSTSGTMTISAGGYTQNAGTTTLSNGTLTVNAGGYTQNAGTTTLSNGTLTVNAGGYTQNAGTTSISNGTFNVTSSGTLAVNSGSFTVSAAATAITIGTLNLGAGATYRTGGKAISSLSTFSANATSNFIYDGTTVENFLTLTTAIYGNVEIANTAGSVTVLSGNTAIVEGTLSFTTNARIITSPNTGAGILRIGVSGSISGANSNRFVSGSLERVINDANPVVFPVGITSPSTSYRPAEFDYTDFTGGSNVIIRVEFDAGALPGWEQIPGTGNISAINGFYTVSSVGGTPPTNPEFQFTGRYTTAGFVPKSRARMVRQIAPTTSDPTFELLTVFSNNEPNDDLTATLSALPTNNGYIGFASGGAVVRWDGGSGDGLWTSGGNWDGDVVPGSLDQVILDNTNVSGSYTVTLNSASLQTIESLTIDSGTDLTDQITLQLTNTNAQIRLLSSTNSLTVSGNDVITLSGTSSLIDNNGGGTLSFNASSTFNIASTLSAALLPAVYGTLNVTNASGTISITGNVEAQTAFSKSNAGSLTITGNLTAPTITLSSGALSVTGILAGNFNLNGGTFTPGSSTSFTGNTLTFGGGALASSGRIRFNGTAAQAISGTGTFFQLQVDNANGVTMSDDITVTDNLILSNGNITTGSNTLIFSNAAVTLTGSASSFVDGRLSVSMPNTASTRFFPVGKAVGGYRPVEISKAGTNTPVVRVEMINTAPTAGSLGSMNRISTVRYYEVTLVSGAITNPTVNLTFDPTEEVNTPTNLVVARSADNNNWTSAGQGAIFAPGVAPFTGDITSLATTFEASPNPTYFALGSLTPDNPLPVQLSSFTLTPRQRSIELVWQTESESENKGFIILRSESETGGYQEIASYLNTPALLGQGTTSSATRYRYVDSHNLQPGRAYWYKLVDIDFGGRRHEHQPMSVQTAFEYALDQNYPNPFNPSTAIQFSLEKPGKTVLEIYNTLGQKVATLVNGELSAGAHRYQWNASGLASGVYFYRLQSNEFVATKKMILVK